MSHAQALRATHEEVAGVVASQAAALAALTTQLDAARASVRAAEAQAASNAKVRDGGRLLLTCTGTLVKS